MVSRLNGVSAFNTEYLNEPDDPDSRFFQYKTYRKLWNYQGLGDDLWLVPWAGNRAAGTPPVKLGDCALFAATDPSMGQSTRADYSAIIILARAPTGQKFVLGADIQRRTPYQIMADQTRWYQKYPQIIRWTIETVAFQALFASDSGLQSLSATGGLPLVATPANQSNKVMRIQSLQPDLANGYILLCEDGQELLKSQIEHYGHTTHDDGPDALEMVRTLSNDYLVAESSAITLVNPYQYGSDAFQDEPEGVLGEMGTSAFYF
jgi:predicted phage terminase large subunit-like protein